MKRYAVVSSNNNSDYLFFIPYIEHAWKQLGWDLCIMLTNDVDVNKLDVRHKSTVLIQLPKIDGLRSESIAQAGRLYAANYLPLSSLIMTSDMDLLPLSDYWNPSIEDVTVYGHDLTWHSFYPMGYTAMSGHKWKELMRLSYNTEVDMLRDAKEFEHLAYAPDWESWWNWDWTQLTARLRGHVTKFVDRGQVNIAGATLAQGRVDRYNWAETMKQTEWIDAHCHNNNVLHPDKMADFLNVYESKYGKL